MLESQYVTNIIYELGQIGAKAVKFVENEYTEKGTPDIIGSYKGMCFVIEAKVGYNEASKIQEQRLIEWSASEAIAVVATYPTHKPKDVVKVIQDYYIGWLHARFMATPKSWPNVSQFP